MNIVIAGCGRVGSALANTLADEGHDVTVVDRRGERLEALGSTFNGSVIEGLAYDVEVLRRAGIEQADVFVAVTDDDNANLMAAEVAKVVYGVPKTIARLYDPAREESYRALDVRHVTGTTLISKVIHEQVVEEEFEYHVAFAGGEVEIVEFVLGPESAGVPVKHLEISDRLRVAAVRRGRRTIIPDDDFPLQPNDLVVAAARRGTAGRIRKFLTDVSGGGT